VTLALDTNRYTDSCRGDESVLELIRLADAVVIPFVVLAELRSGFVGGDRALANEQILIRFLNAPRVTVAYADAQTTHWYAQIAQQLRRQGTPLPINDVWIAALVLQHNLTLCTRDAHFRHLAQIPLA
jgi:tRNA(fMet)-specific endonuclease VapC